MSPSVYVTHTQQTTVVTQGFHVVHETIAWMPLLTQQQQNSLEMKKKLKGDLGNQQLV